VSAFERENPGPVRILGKVVWLEMLRRRDLAVLLILMSVFALASGVFRLAGIDSPETATFLTNLGMTLAWAFAHILTLLLAARQFPEEIESRTLHPVLARPVGRSQVILAKLLACAGCGISVYGVLAGIAWVSVPRLETFAPDTFAQMFAAMAASLALLAAFALAASLWLPQGVTVVLGAVLVFAGGPVSGLLHNRLGRAGDVLAGWLPSFHQLNLTTRFTDGIAPASPAEFAALMTHTALCGAALFWLASARFARRSL
jgi:ABC-type transport system involved in multi-copper enzyme maturation permease subunit